MRVEKILGLIIFCIVLSIQGAFATDINRRVDNRVREYISPVRIVWKSDRTGKYILNEYRLLGMSNGQADLFNQNLCELKAIDGETPAILLDFGKEMHGGLELVTGRWKGGKPLAVRVRFGESVTEAMSDLEGESNAKNDHAIRDQKILLPWLGKKEIGNTGFRFVRIDLLDEEATLSLKEVNAIAVYRDVDYIGSFKSNDEELNKIWQTGAYTVHLNMQNFLWDGIKRDRLVWIGDMHPEVMTINSVFGYNEVVPKSLDLIRDMTPLPQWMNGISSYSMWWLLIHYNWYYYQGDFEYLKEQKDYIKELLELFCSRIDKDGKENLDGMRFLDWPSSANKVAIDAGYQALLKLTLEAGGEIMELMGENEVAKECHKKAKLLKKADADPNGAKQAAALLALADIEPAKKVTEEIIMHGGAQGISTFYGYYVLQAMAKAGEYGSAMDLIKEYWGAMLKLGGTTFWEDFDINWMENAARIDEIVPEGKVDIHATKGGYCYKGLRHSLCHGWASGPTAWLSEHVLGVKVIEPGFTKVKIEPNLGNLDWVEGTFPTPKGVIKIRHEKLANGKVKSTITAPEGVEIVKK